LAGCRYRVLGSFCIIFPPGFTPLFPCTVGIEVSDIKNSIDRWCGIWSSLKPGPTPSMQEATPEMATDPPLDLRPKIVASSRERAKKATWKIRNI